MSMTDTAIHADVATAIRVQLARRGERQADLARALGSDDLPGLKQPNLSNRMRGKQDFTLTELGAIAAYFEVEVSDLLIAASRWISPEQLGTSLDFEPAA